MKLVFDTEANGLLFDADTIWCVVCKDRLTGAVSQFTPDSISGAIEFLMSAKMLIGHNISQYDIPLIEKLSGVNLFDHCTIRDTYCMSKMFYPERLSHSLESYGEQFQRAKPVHEDWTRYSSEMLHRCTEDVEINDLTYSWLVQENCQDWDWILSLELEQEFAYNQGLQELAGVDIDLDVCHKIVRDIDREVEEIDATIRPLLPKRVKKKGETVKKPFKINGEYTKAVLEWFSI